MGKESKKRMIKENRERKQREKERERENDQKLRK